MSRLCDSKKCTALVVLFVLLVGCSHDEESRYGAPPIPKPVRTSPTVTRSPGSESRNLPAEDEIVSQYKHFWLSALPGAYEAAPDRRHLMLKRVVTAKIEGKLLDRITALEKKGRTSYGHDTPISQQVEWSRRSPNYVLVRGCLDSSSTGVADVATGRRLTIGVPENPVLMNLRREDGVWLISGFRFPGGQCR